MKAILCRQYGPPESLTLEDLPSLVPGPKQVVIAVRAAGVNFPDTLIIQGKYQFKPDMPFSPGGEVAGVIRAVGTEVTGLHVGDRVLAPLGWGGYAEEAIAEAWRVLPIPPDMDFATASAFVLTYGTSHHALKDRAQLRPGETVLVLGAAGGVGLAAIEIAKAMGARVIAAASSDEKLAVCAEHGADELIQYERDDLRERLKQITQGRGVDVVYDPVGGAYSEAVLRSTAWNGRFLVVGFAAGDIPSIPLNLPLLKGCAIVGVFWGAFARNEPARNAQNMDELLAWFQQGKVRPHICARYPLEQAADAMKAIASRAAKGKVVITMAGASS
ncbi:NADPH:quinone oxidoreductase family protein [Variovorax sp. J22P240]|uniref:NADPH:quinone oxidoreductase family protein n=1 Tax=Variovorax sp. J22P240 TaxID=3053514 RepID=UPI00257629D4|nr:NADPH:quinone oxidoreductase family protein [Variovorax sp. J22P240]MDM0001769.1 NADPH:quinone oxidoreductase family protein [Variovorax sp. J22P240]